MRFWGIIRVSAGTARRRCIDRNARSGKGLRRGAGWQPRCYICRLLDDGGAQSIVRHNGIPAVEHPDMWPDNGEALEIDVQRAVAAVNGGDSLISM